MALWKLFLVFVLQFEAGISGGPYFLYHRPGNYVILPCDNVPDMCSMVTWFYNREPSQTIQVVYHGDVKNSTQAARLRLHSDCSLCINNITTEDAGVYNCRLEGTTGQDTTVYLNILTISASPSNPDLQMNGSITLKCSLFRLSSLPCDEISIRWVDDTGTVLLDKVGYTGRTCISLLTVKLHSDQNKRYTCQIVEENNVKMEAHYTPVFIDFRESMEQSPLSYAMWHLRIAALILMIGITILVIRYRGNKKLLEESNVRYVGDCDDATVIYENVTKSG